MTDIDRLTIYNKSYFGISREFALESRRIKRNVSGGNGTRLHIVDEHGGETYRGSIFTLNKHAFESNNRCHLTVSEFPSDKDRVVRSQRFCGKLDVGPLCNRVAG